jgi:hypothetical protein
MTRVTAERNDGAEAAGAETAFANWPEQTLLAQNHTVVAAVPDYDSFIHDPGLAVLPNGVLVVASPCWQRRPGLATRPGWQALRDAGVPYLVAQDQSQRRQFALMARSRDGGKTWEQLDRLPFSDTTPFAANGRLYMFAQYNLWSDLYITASDDEGSTWAEPVKILEGLHWNCSTPRAVLGNRLYWAMNCGSWLNMIVLSADLDKDLLTKEAWRKSNVARRPPTPSSMTRNLHEEKDAVFTHYWGADNWMEPNIFVVNGRLRIATRAVIDEQTTANIACIGDVEDDDRGLRLRFTQFYGWPGGQNKFFILDDRKSGLFWMLCNLVTDSQDSRGNTAAALKSGFRGSLGNERRNLALFYSVDALNWIPAGIAARWPGMLQSFMYPSAAIDGDDIVFISRTSQYARHQHDADRTTFHRIRNFRDLALDLTPRAASFERLVPPPFPARRPLPDAILGRWMWHTGRNFSFEKDGRLTGAKGNWSALSAERCRVSVEEQSGSLELIGDGSLLIGRTDDGAEIWAVKQP